MPRALSELTDVYYEPVPTDLPVEQPFKTIPNDIPRIVISSNVGTDNIVRPVPDYVNPPAGNAVAKLTGAEGERFQLWPEKILREGITAAGKVMSGEVPQWSIDKDTGDVHTSPQMIEKAQEISALAGSGGLAGGVEGAALNATPSLRPALRYKDKLYKGKEGQQHLDVIPEQLYPDFQKKAMSGEDINDYNFGFINDKGQFLTREKALEYGINTGLIDPAAGKYGALTSTLMADSSKPGTAIEAVAKTAPTFYSAVEHNVNAIPQAKMTGEQWLGTLANKPGVKGEELDWTGLKGFLEENKGKPVTKEQIQEHLAQNKVELKEVSKGGDVQNITVAQAKQLAAEGKPFHAVEKANPERVASVTNDKGQILPWAENNSDKFIFRPGSFEDAVNLKGSSTKYHDYQLPGGKNYREVLLTLPPTKNTLNQFKVINEHGQVDSTWTDKAKAEAWANKKGFTVREDKPITLDGGYKSSHWDEPNILAHVRMNDRTIDGKKSLHVEEIQSDWHQQGRDKGYRPEQEKQMANLIKQRDELQKEGSTLSPGDARYKEIYAELPKLQTKINEIGSGGVGVPDAPFKKTWHELALKRMLREAAEKGYDRLSWTPGEAQAARYDLSKQIDKLKYSPAFKSTTTGKEFEGRLVAYDKNGQVVLDKNTKPEGLPDIVGKEAADKLLKTAPNKTEHELRPYHYLQGQDLKIGGEGMKGFYDQIIPKSVNKLAKEYGAKVETRKTKEGHTVHFIDLPEGLKNVALQKGFPLFSNGYMLVPIQGDPFKER